MRFRYVALGFVLLFAAITARAQDAANGPVALIVSYHARPGMRAQFRRTMASEGIAHLEGWKKAGVFASYNELFTAYSGASKPDMFLVLTFAHFTGLGRWQKIEATYPGGLPLEAQSLGWAESTETADIVQTGGTIRAVKDAQFFILEYDVTADMPKYVSYVKGYVVPQFDEWMRSGALAGYACYINQNTAGAPWSSLIVLEYKDLKALSEREAIKTEARERLSASNPAWKKWSGDKTEIRKEAAAIPVLSLNPAVR